MGRQEKAESVRSILDRVIVHDGSLEVRIDLEAAAQVMSGKTLSNQNGRNNEIAHTFSVSVAFRHTAQGNALKLVIGNERTESCASREAIAKAIARARSWYDQIVQGKATSLPDITRQHRLTHRYVKNIFPLAFLGPESVEALLKNRAGQARTLDSLLGKVPMRWDQQRSFIDND